jgi:ferrous iron transport protein A
MRATVIELDLGQEAVIHALVGGEELQRKLRSLGIREGKNVIVRARHPFGGPLVVEVDRRQASVGRGMAERIVVELPDAKKGGG